MREITKVSGIFYVKNQDTAITHFQRFEKYFVRFWIYWSFFTFDLCCKISYIEKSIADLLGGKPILTLVKKKARLLERVEKLCLNYWCHVGRRSVNEDCESAFG